MKGGSIMFTILLMVFSLFGTLTVNAQMCADQACCLSCCGLASPIVNSNNFLEACNTGCGNAVAGDCTQFVNSCGLGVKMHDGGIASDNVAFGNVNQNFCCFSDGNILNPAAPVSDCTVLAGAPTLSPTTPAPTTPAPTTPAPTTPAPTTPAPTTPAPTTPAPTTPAPTTPAPTTPAPTTPAPTTPAPTTPAPTTPAPVTPAPVTPAPVTPAPVTPAPVTPAPVTPAPVTPAPVTPAPTTRAPTTPAPVTPPPSTPAPVTPPPTTPPPTNAPPTTPPPTNAPPTTPPPTDPPVPGQESNNDDSGALPIIVGIVAVVAIIGVLLAVVVTRRRKPSTSKVPLEEMKTSLYGGNSKDGGTGAVPFADVVYENNAAFGATNLADVKLKPVPTTQTGAAAFTPSPFSTAITPKPPTDITVGKETPKSKKFSPAKKEDDTLSRFELKGANAAVNTSDADPLAAFMPPNSAAQKPVVDEQSDDPLSAFILPKSTGNELAAVAPKKSTPGRKSGMPTPGNSKRGTQQKKSFSGMPRPKESAGGVIPKGQKVEAKQQSAEVHPPHEADARISMGYLDYATKNPNRESLFRPSEEYLEKQREQTESAKGKKSPKPAKKPAGKPGNIDDDI